MNSNGLNSVTCHVVRLWKEITADRNEKDRGGLRVKRVSQLDIGEFITLSVWLVTPFTGK